MGILDVFKGKKNSLKESNTLFGQTQLGNNMLYTRQNGGRTTVSQQLLYVTTSSVTAAGRTVDMSMLSRNSTVMACIGVIARALAQLPVTVVYKDDKGMFVNALESDKIGARDKNKARQVVNLLQTPNNFQSQYEFWYQWCMWYCLAGETFTLLWRENQDNQMQTPIEMYNLDATLITCQLTETRYPNYLLSTSTFGFNKETPLNYYQVVHVMEQAWQGSAGFNKGILATELMGLDQDIDLYANFVMQNGAKPSGMFMTEQVIPDSKYKEIAGRLKEAWASMIGSKQTDLSKPGQSILLDQGMRYEKVDMLTLQDADAAKLKEQTMKRICGLFGVPPAMIGIADQKYNNTQTMLDEFYKSTMSPMIDNLQAKFKSSLLKGFPNLSIQFDTKDFLKGAPIDQMNFINAGVAGGILTPNEAREYLGMPNIEGGDELKSEPKQGEPLPGSSPKDTGGGGGSDAPKAAIKQ
jgi:HK97 family phage portal protein